MAKQLVMDRSGDTKHEFDAANSVEVKEAMQRFDELIGKGYTAAKRTAPGQTEKITAFDPSIEETVFFPQLVGG